MIEVPTDSRFDVMTQEEVAEELKLRPSTVGNLARRGIIPSYKIGGARRYSAKAIARYLQQVSEGETPAQSGRSPR